MYAASPSRLLLGTAGTTTCRPASSRAGRTAAKLAASANAPCTSTTVGVVMVISLSKQRSVVVQGRAKELATLRGGGPCGVGVGQDVQHHEVVDGSAVADGRDGNSGGAQTSGVRLALVAEHVSLRRDHHRRRQTGQLLQRSTQRGRGDLGTLVGIGRVLVPEPEHGVPPEPVVLSEPV